MPNNYTIELPDTSALVPVADRYADNGRPAILLVEQDTGDLWCDLTVNLPDYALPDDDWTFVPAERRAYLRVLEQAGLIADAGGAVPYGNFGQRALMVRFSSELLAEKDIRDIAPDV